MLSNLLYAKLVLIPSVCYIPNFYLQNCVYFSLVPFLLYGIGNLLEYVAAFLTSACVRGREGRTCDLNSRGCRFEANT